MRTPPAERDVAPGRRSPRGPRRLGRTGGLRDPEAPKGLLNTVFCAPGTLPSQGCGLQAAGGRRPPSSLAPPRPQALRDCSPPSRPPGGPAHFSCRRPIPTPSHSCFPQETDSWAPGCHGDKQMRAAGLGLRLARGRVPPPGEAGLGARLYKGTRGSALGRGRRGRTAGQAGRGAGQQGPRRGRTATSRAGTAEDEDKEEEQVSGGAPAARRERAPGRPRSPAGDRSRRTTSELAVRNFSLRH